MLRRSEAPGRRLARAFRRCKRLFSRYLPAIGCLLAGCGLTLFAFWSSLNQERSARRWQFELAAENRIASIRRELDVSLSVLNSLHALFESSEQVTASEFEAHVSKMAPKDGGFRAVEWLPRVDAAERGRYERTQGYPILERDDRPSDGPVPLRRSANRELYFPVTYLYPQQANPGVYGFDPGSGNPSSPAIRKSCQTGERVVLSRIRLVQDPPDISSVLVYSPLPGRGKPWPCRGVLMIAFQVRDVVERGVKVLRPEGVHLVVRDVTTAKNPVFLYSHRSRLAGDSVDESEPQMAVKRTFDVGGRTWQIASSPAGPFLTTPLTWDTWWILGASLISTLLATSYAALMVGRTARTRLLVLRRTQDLRRAHRVAVEASRAKSQFLANVSHEIRTPMNGVMGMTELMLNDPLTGEQRRSVLLIREAAGSLMNLINDILDFSKAEAARLTLDTAQFSLPQLVESVQSVVAPGALQRGIDLRREIAENVPEQVVGDATRLRQILLNLAGNAIKFTEKGSVMISVSLDGTEGDFAIVRFEVTDTGIGISEQDQRILFQPFTQADSSYTRRHGGAGLGLAICKQLVGLMQGTIGVTSSAGAGSTFWFTARLGIATYEPKPLSAGKVIPRLAGTRVLLVEDNRINQNVAVRLLQLLGSEVHVANNGREALDAVSGAEFDVILMDCQMPEMDGYQATAEIRRLYHGGEAVPIIAMTAHAMPGDRERCLQAGMNDYVSKPISAQTLCDAICRHLRRQVMT